MFFGLCVIIASSWLVKTGAFPTGRGISCVGGTDAAPLFRHGPSSGTLFTADIVFQVNGVTINTTASSIPIQASSVVRFNVIGSNTIGIFIRFESMNNQTISSSFFAVSNSLQYAQNCISPLTGISHIDTSFKPDVITSFDTTTFTGEFRISISVVHELLKWYYSSFILKIDPKLIAKPSTKPIKKPTTKPTKKPTAKPTAKPTTKPTTNPTKKPVKPPKRRRFCFFRCPMKKSKTVPTI